MKSTFLLMSYLVLSVVVWAQEATYELSVKDQSLLKVLQKVEEEVGLLFSYQKKNIANVQKDFNIKVAENNYASLLKQLFRQTGLSFKIVDEKYVVITKKEAIDESHICGVIVDEQTREKLPYANVIVKGKSVGAVSNVNGFFELKHPFESNDSLNISYIGYEGKAMHYTQLKEATCPTIELSYPKIKEAFLIISDYLTDGVSVEHNGASTDIKPRLCGNVAGVLEPDVLATIQFLPGISNPSSRVSDIYIRGCKPDQNLVTWEDIPIYHTAHYFGMISAFNPFIIESTKIYRGGFNSTYGGRLGGVIELQSGNENTYHDYMGVASDMTHTKAYLHQKLNFKKPSAITFSVRRPFNELVETPTFKTYSRFTQQGLVLENKELAFIDSIEEHIDITNDFKFLDTHAKFSSTLNENNRIEIAGLFANNIFNDHIEDNKISRIQQDSLYLQNYGASVKWYHQWDGNWQTTLKGIATNYELDYAYQIDDERIKETLFLEGLKQNNIKENQLNIANIYQMKEAQHVEFGYQLTNYNVDFKVTENVFRRGNIINNSRQSQANVHTLYTHYQNPISNKIGIQAGFRLSYNPQAKTADSDKQAWYIEPRLRLDYRLSKAISLHSSYGKHHQFLGEVYTFEGDRNGFNIPLWALAERKSIEVQTAHLYQVGAIYQAKTWVVDAQIYGRTIKGLSSRLYEFEELLELEPGNTITGKSDIKGLDLLIKKRTGKLRSWLSYSFNKTTLVFKERRRKLLSFPADYEQRHVFDFTNQLRLQDWHLALGFKISSGLPYTKITGYKEQQPMGNIPPPGEMMPPIMPPDMGIPSELKPEYGAINVHQLPATKSINVSAEYQLKPSPKKWKMYAGCSIKNILNFRNIASRYYTIDSFQEGNPIRPVDKIDLPFTPNVTFRMEW